MENRVDLASRRQFQFICDCTHTSDDGERSEELERELVVGTPDQGRLQIWLELQEDFITNREGPFHPILISLVLHSLLHTEEVLADRCQDQGPVL
jgi:hypothetical protein